jgi:hypothetical protein
VSPATAALAVAVITVPQLPELGRIWAADRKDKRAAAARERRAAS